MVLDEANSLVLARLALPEFGYDPETVPLTFVKMRENTVFRADTPDGPIALRLHRPGYRSRQEISAESEFIEVLAERGFPVVRLVPTLAGEYTAVVSDGETEAVVDAQRWLEGSRPLGDTEADTKADAESGAAGDAAAGEDRTGTDDHAIDRSDFAAMGAIAARIHNVAEELAGARTFPRTPWDAEGMVGERALWGDALTVPGLDEAACAQLRRTRSQIFEELSAFGDAPDVYGTIHADFTPENVLVSDGELVVIDFDDFGDGWYLFDLATVLFWYVRDPSYPEFREALLEGYRTMRALDREEERLLQLFIVVRGFTYLGWAATRPETETAAFLVAEIVPLVVKLAAELEQTSGNRE